MSLLETSSVGCVALLGAAIFAAQSHATEVPPPCDKIEDQMSIWDAEPFGHDASGLTIEGYANDLDITSFTTTDENGKTYEVTPFPAPKPGPIKALDFFNGLRVVDCKTGRIVAIRGDSAELKRELLSSRLLNTRIKNRSKIELSQVRKVADKIYSGSDAIDAVLSLRETEETCGCRLHFPNMWGVK